MKQNGRFIFYHRTSPTIAREIVESGFRNRSGYFMGNRTWTGVWLSSVPVDSQLDAQDEALLMVKLKVDEKELSRWEWTAEGRSHREWLIPAALINKCATVEMVDQMDTSTVAA
jgi:hypothetical protein